MSQSTTSSDRNIDESTIDAHKSAMRSSLVNVSKLTSAMMITVPLGMVTRILLPRWLGSDASGKLYFSEIFPVFLVSLMQLGIPSYIQKTVPTRPEHAREILRPLFLFLMGVSFCITVGTWIFLYLNHYSREILILTVIMASYQTLTTTYDIIQRLFISLDRVGIVAIFSIATKVLVVGLVLASVLIFHELLYIGSAFLIGQASALGLLLAYSCKQGFWSSAAPLSILRPIFTVSIPFFIVSTVSQINGSVDAMMLSRLADFRETGLFGTCQRLQGLFLIFATIAQSALTPILSRTFLNQPENYKRIQSIFLRIVLISTFPLSLFMILFSKEIIFIVFGKDFIDAHSAMMLSGLTLFASSTVLLLSQHLIVATNGRRMAILLFSSLLPRVFLMYLLIPIFSQRYGAGGAASAAVMGTIFSESLIAAGFFLICRKDIDARRIFYTATTLFFPLVMILGLKEYWQDFTMIAKLAGAFILGPCYLMLTGNLAKKHVTDTWVLLRSVCFSTSTQCPE